MRWFVFLDGKMMREEFAAEADAKPFAEALIAAGEQRQVTIEGFPDDSRAPMPVFRWDDAADSPIVKFGDEDQFTFGLAISKRFSLDLF